MFSSRTQIKYNSAGLRGGLCLSPQSGTLDQCSAGRIGNRMIASGRRCRHAPTTSKLLLTHQIWELFTSLCDCGREFKLIISGRKFLEQTGNDTLGSGGRSNQKFAFRHTAFRLLSVLLLPSSCERSVPPLLTTTVSFIMRFVTDHLTQRRYEGSLFRPSDLKAGLIHRRPAVGHSQDLCEAVKRKYQLRTGAVVVKDTAHQLIKHSLLPLAGCKSEISLARRATISLRYCCGSVASCPVTVSYGKRQHQRSRCWIL